MLRHHVADVPVQPAPLQSRGRCFSRALASNPHSPCECLRCSCSMLTVQKLTQLSSWGARTRSARADSGAPGGARAFRPSRPRRRAPSSAVKPGHERWKEASRAGGSLLALLQLAAQAAHGDALALHGEAAEQAGRRAEWGAGMRGELRGSGRAGVPAPQLLAKATACRSSAWQGTRRRRGWSHRRRRPAALAQAPAACIPPPPRPLYCARCPRCRCSRPHLSPYPWKRLGRAVEATLYSCTSYRQPCFSAGAGRQGEQGRPRGERNACTSTPPAASRAGLQHQHARWRRPWGGGGVQLAGLAASVDYHSTQEEASKQASKQAGIVAPAQAMAAPLEGECSWRPTPAPLPSDPQHTARGHAPA